ncbi:polysaccharide biosynthesis/export family protein [Ascidiimonas sp. W6]|uniref:polysaccharide biosynthesis/export family protein n=1 Tax=Ascidiimonas meishanensis TaxID=3128903 RepID=UPI0030ED180F
MKFRSFFYCLSVLLVLQSCIPNKKLIYLQDKDGKRVIEGTVSEMSKPYKIQVNDILYIDIKASEPELVAMFNISKSENEANLINNGGLYFAGYVVDVHGNIRLPILNELNVLGFTANEVRQRIEKSLLENYLNSSSNLFVTVKLAGLNYSVLGEVTRPGNNVLFQERVNVLEAVANAGDVLVTGDREDVLIIRQYPDGKQIHHVDLTDKGLLNSPYFYILPNDMIYVKPLNQKSWGVGTTGTQTLTTVLSIVSIITSTVLLIRNL